MAKYPALRASIASLKNIPAGTFQMGSSTGDTNERPVNIVRLSDFRLGATPITVAVWKEYCAANNLKMPNFPKLGWKDDHPIVYVSWNDIMGVDGKGGFCAWASDIAGFRLTLPTEAQFEYTSRGSHRDLVYPWGNKFDRSKLWCSRTSIGDAKRTAPVSRTSNIYRNTYGLTDMLGNVWHWCSDWYGLYGSASQTDPPEAKSSSVNSRCVRGGSWYSFRPDKFRCGIRGGMRLDDSDDTIGFRLAAGPG